MNLADFRLGRDRTQEPLLHAGSGLFGARWMGGHCQAVLGDVCCFLFSPNQSPTVSLPVIFHVSRGAAGCSQIKFRFEDNKGRQI